MFAAATVDNNGRPLSVSEAEEINERRLRDEFAGQALAGMLASKFVSEHAGNPTSDTGMVHGLATRSYQIADAMLAERAKTGK